MGSHGRGCPTRANGERQQLGAEPGSAATGRQEGALEGPSQRPQPAPPPGRPRTAVADRHWAAADGRPTTGGQGCPTAPPATDGRRYQPAEGTPWGPRARPVRPPHNRETRYQTTRPGRRLAPRGWTNRLSGWRCRRRRRRSQPAWSWAIAETGGCPVVTCVDATGGGRLAGASR